MTSGMPQEDFKCPITLDVMRDPVVLHTAAGRSYERGALEEHLRRNPRIDPSTGLRASHRLEYTPNRNLKNVIEAWPEPRSIQEAARQLVAADRHTRTTRERAARCLAVRPPYQPMNRMSA